MDGYRHHAPAFFPGFPDQEVQIGCNVVDESLGVT
jgi:hypothetical protein